ncbi:unnamed protein product [Arctogadus glacialis]
MAIAKKDLESTIGNIRRVKYPHVHGYEAIGSRPRHLLKTSTAQSVDSGRDSFSLTRFQHKLTPATMSNLVGGSRPGGPLAHLLLHWLSPAVPHLLCS